MNVPDELRYTSDHEWIRLENGKIRVGITDYAQDALGDVVFVQLPDPGTRVDAGASFSEVESTKSVSDIYAPLAGTVTEGDGELADAPQPLEEEPHGGGRVCILEPPHGGAFQKSMDAQ